MPAVDQNPEEFLEMIAGIQSRRMDDQRASLPFLPGLQNPARVLGPHLEKRKQENVSKTNSGVVPSAGEKPPGAQTKLLKSKSADIAQKASGKSDKKELDDDFYEMLIKCQSTRIEEQRSELPGPSAVKAAPTVPDEDFFQLIMRLQARRFDEQRAALSPSSLKNESSSEETSGPGRGGSSNPNKEVKNTTVNSDQQKPPKRTASQKIKKR